MSPERRGSRGRVRGDWATRVDAEDRAGRVIDHESPLRTWVHAGHRPLVGRGVEAARRPSVISQVQVVAPPLRHPVANRIASLSVRECHFTVSSHGAGLARGTAWSPEQTHQLGGNRRYGATSTVTGVPLNRSSTARSPSAAARVAVAVRRAPTAEHAPPSGARWGCLVTITTTASSDSTASAV